MPLRIGDVIRINPQYRHIRNDHATEGFTLHSTCVIVGRHKDRRLLCADFQTGKVYQAPFVQTIWRKDKFLTAVYRATHPKPRGLINPKSKPKQRRITQ